MSVRADVTADMLWEPQIGDRVRATVRGPGWSTGEEGVILAVGPRYLQFVVQFAAYRAGYWMGRHEFERCP